MISTKHVELQILGSCTTAKCAFLMFWQENLIVLGKNHSRRYVASHIDCSTVVKKSINQSINQSIRTSLRWSQPPKRSGAAKLQTCIDLYVTGRAKKYSLVNGTESLQIPAINGIPQGSALGPLLFTFFIYDLLICVKSRIKLYVDDTKLPVYAKI